MAAAASAQRRELFEERLGRVFRAAMGRGPEPGKLGPAGWLARHELVDLNPRQVQRYLAGDVDVPDRIFAVLDILEREYGLGGEDAG